MNDDLKRNKAAVKLTYDNLITVIFIFLLGITLVYNLVFQDGSKTFRIILTFGSILFMKFIFKVTFLKKSKASYVASLIFIFMSMYLGNIFNFYTIVSSYDKILHFVSGIIIGIIGFIIYAHFTKEYMKKLNPKFLILFIFIFCVALAGCWEIWEFTGDKLFGFNSQNSSLVDTMMDIICGTIGGIIPIFPIYKFVKGNNNNKFLNHITNEVI